MARLLIHVEGVTEETFVNEVLANHLWAFGYEAVSARLIGNARQRARRGGIKGWGTVKQDIIRHLQEDSGCIATTMVDYYGLPRTGDKAWPGRAEAALAQAHLKAPLVEMALLNDIVEVMGAHNRFVPFVIMHEFEAFLFSDCNRFARAIGREDLANSFQAIRDQFPTPEEINDSPLTAPSKRLESLLPGYEKPLLGNLAALEIGLDRIRAACPHFQRWLVKLEGMGA